MHRTTEEFIALLQPHYNSAAQYCRALFQGRKDAEDDRTTKDNGFPLKITLLEQFEIGRRM